VKRTILCWLCSAVPVLAGTSWPYVDYKEVRAYAWKEPMEWTILLRNATDVGGQMLSAGLQFAGIPCPAPLPNRVEISEWVDTFLASPSEGMIHKDMTLPEGVINKDGALLNAQQVKRLLKAEARRFRSRGVAGCYSPHNAFVFYDAEKRPVAFLEICFDCIGSRTVPEDAQCDPDFHALAVLFSELKLPLGRPQNPKQVQEAFNFTLGLAKKSPKSKGKPGAIPGIPGLDVAK
jgi:hypothetical protein